MALVEAGTEQGLDDEKLVAFSFLRRHVWQRLPSWLRTACDRLLFGIGPDVPTTLSDSVGSGSLRRVAAWASGIAFVLCGVTVSVWTALAGTLIGSDPRRTYFVQDWPNIVNYTVLCPAYVGLGVSLIFLVMRSWPTLSALPARLAPAAPPPASLPAGIVIGGSVWLSAVLTGRYVAELNDAAIYPKVGWWITTIGEGGARIPGGLGTYYTILNFALLLVCILAVVSYVAVTARCVQIARGLRATAPLHAPDFDYLRDALASFVMCYIVAKLLVMVLMLNAYTWRAVTQKPMGSVNYVLLGVVLSTLGVFFVAVPRYFIELEWFHLKVRRAAALGEYVDGADDLRSVGVRLVANLADTAVVGGFILSFWFGL